MAAALEQPNAPDHYREDLSVALGLVPADDERLENAVLRLASELVCFLQERDVLFPPGVAGFVSGDTLDRLRTS